MRLLRCRAARRPRHWRVALAAQPPAAPAPRGRPSRASTPTRRRASQFLKRVEAYVALAPEARSDAAAAAEAGHAEQIDTHAARAGAADRSRRGAAPSRATSARPTSAAYLRRQIGRGARRPGRRGRSGSRSWKRIPASVKLRGQRPLSRRVPLSTMPPQVLAALPQAAGGLEYRFIGDRLILLDVHAHTHRRLHGRGAFPDSRSPAADAPRTSRTDSRSSSASSARWLPSRIAAATRRSGRRTAQAAAAGAAAADAPEQAGLAEVRRARRLRHRQARAVPARRADGARAARSSRSSW